MLQLNAFIFILLFCCASFTLHAQDEILTIEQVDLIEEDPVYDIGMDAQGNKIFCLEDHVYQFTNSGELSEIKAETGAFAVTLIEGEDLIIQLRNNMMLYPSAGYRYPILARNLDATNAMVWHQDRLILATEFGIRAFKLIWSPNGFVTKEVDVVYANEILKGRVNTVHVDRKGDLWIASVWGLFRVQNGKLELMLEKTVTAITEKNESLFVAGAKWVKEFKNLKVWKTKKLCPELANYRIEDLAIDSKKNIWIASNVLAKIDSTGACTSYGKGEGFTSRHAVKLLVDNNDELWVGTEGKGIFHVYYKKIEDSEEMKERYEFMGDNPANNVVFLIDASSSMKAEHKLPNLQSRMKEISRKMRPEDEISILSFAGNGKIVLAPTSSINNEIIEPLINNMKIGGRSNVKSGLELAFETAAANFKIDGVNQIIISTDGEFDISNELKNLAVTYKKRGISLTVFDFAESGNRALKKLARKGGGRYQHFPKGSTNLFQSLLKQVRRKVN